MTQATPKDYWISPNALYIERNALGNPDYIQANCASGAQILVYVKGIPGLDYDAGHNYRRWSLQAAPTVFNTHTAKYIYAAIPRPTTVPDASASGNAMVVFPSEIIDIYGKNEAEEQIGSENFYYINLGGILTSSGDNGTINREWEQPFNTGYLSSDEAISAGATDSEWYSYSAVSRLTTFIKDLTMKAGTIFHNLYAKAITIVTGGEITFEQGGTVNGIANTTTPYTSTDKIATPKYVDDIALSKRHDDKTDFGLEMASLRVNGTTDIFGNLVVERAAALKGGAEVGTASNPAPLTVHGDVTVGTYNQGISGANIDFYGNAEFESIVARRFLEVPEFRFNRTTITVGNKWQTKGGGIIEEVWDQTTVPDVFASAYEGIAKLKLEDGEPGAIDIDDKCQGIFHFTDKDNDADTSDTKDGNFHFAGFTTVYFVIKEIYTADTLPQFLKSYLESKGESMGSNQFFRYELRAKSCKDLPATNRNHWTDDSLPQPSMHFACYANATNASRQASRLTTTTYQLHLAGMTDWTYDQDNIRLIIGWLDGFTLRQRVWDKDSKTFIEVDKPLHGEGIAVGNIYMWGNIDQFDRAPSLISQQLCYKATSGNTPDGIFISTNHQQYNLNGFSTNSILPSPENRYVWQQWLYSYSDGTYDVSDVSLHSVDTTALAVQLNRSLISVAISDWLDADKPDTVTFDVTARILNADQPLAITEALASLSSNGEQSSSLTYTTEFDADSKSVTFHVTIQDFVGVSVDGVTPEDAFLYITLRSAVGEATATVTIAQNREGDDGLDGINGESAVSVVLSANTIVFPTLDGNITEGAVSRQIKATVYVGEQPVPIRYIDAVLSSSQGITLQRDENNGITISPNLTTPAWVRDKVLTITLEYQRDNTPATIQAEVSLTGSAQGQTVTGPPGASISKVEEWYKATTTNVAPKPTDTGWQRGHIEPTAELPYVWNLEIVYISDPVTQEQSVISTDVHLCCTFSDGLLKHESLYLVKDDATVPDESSSGWTDLDTAMSRFSADHRYLWNKETVEYKDATKNRTDIRLVCVWGEKGVAGSQNNLYGYGTKLDTVIAAKNLLHTPTGMACHTNVTATTGNNRHTVMRATINDIVAGKKYAVSGIVYSPCNGNFSVAVGGKFSTVMAVRRNVRTPFSAVIIAGSGSGNDLTTHVRAQIVPTAEAAYSGIFYIDDFKVELAEDTDASTPFNGLAPYSAQQYQNLLPSTADFLNEWNTVQSGDSIIIVENALEGNSAVMRMASGSGDAYFAILSAGKLHLKPNTWYTFSEYIKGDTTINIGIGLGENKTWGGNCPVVNDDAVALISNTRYATFRHEATDEWHRKVYTFRTPADTEGIYLYHDIPAAYNITGKQVMIAMPKLEEAEFVTSWQQNEADRKGDTGADAVTLDIDNEMDSVPCDSNGKVTAATTIRTKATIYKGSAAQTTTIKSAAILGGKTATINGDTATWTFAVGDTLSNDRYTAEVTAEYEGVDRKVLFTLNVVKSGTPGVSPTLYQLRLTDNSIKVDEKGNLTPATSTVYVTKNLDGVITQLSEADIVSEGLSVYYTIDNGAAKTSTTITGYTKNNKKVNVYLSKAGVIIDQETIPIVADGENGDSTLALNFSVEQVFANVADGKVIRDTDVSFNVRQQYGRNNVTEGVSVYAYKQLVYTTDTAVIADSYTIAGVVPTVTLENGVLTVSWHFAAGQSFYDDYRTVILKSAYGSVSKVFHLYPVRKGENGDSADVDFEFSDEENPEPPVGHPNSNPQWHNESTGEDRWMAISKKANGVWGEWQMVNTKGEPGATGPAGTSIEIKGSAVKYFATYSEYNAATKVSGDYLVGEKSVFEPDHGERLYTGAYIYAYNATTSMSVITDAVKGDTYIVEDTGHLFVATQQKDTLLLGNGLFWFDAGEIRGKDAIYISVEGDNVVFPQSGTAQRIFVEVYRGDKKLEYQTDYICSALSSGNTVLDGKVSWSYRTNIPGRAFCYQLFVKTEYRGTDISGTIPFTVTIDGVEYKRNINVRTVLNGTNGYNGCLIRKSEWEPGKTYRNDSDFDSVDPITGQYIIDEVTVSDYNGGEGYTYLCQQTHESTDDNRPSESASTSLWRKLNNQQPLRTPFADITRAFIEYLQAHQVVITDPTTGLPYGAFGAAVGENHYPLWFGGDSPQTAVERHDSNGNVWLSDNFSVVDGVVTAKDMQAEGGTFRNINAVGGTFQNINVQGNVSASMFFGKEVFMGDVPLQEPYVFDFALHPGTIFHTLHSAAHTIRLGRAYFYKGLEVTLVFDPTTRLMANEVQCYDMEAFYFPAGRADGSNTQPIWINSMNGNGVVKLMSVKHGEIQTWMIISVMGRIVALGENNTSRYRLSSEGYTPLL